MRRQRLRAAQAHSVCALCASRLASNAARLPPYGTSPLQIRQNSTLAQASNADGTVKSDSQSSTEGNRHPAAAHALPHNFSDPPNGQSETQKPLEPSSGDGEDDLSFMDSVGVLRGSTVARQQLQNAQSPSSAHSTTQPATSTPPEPDSGGGKSDPGPEIATQAGQGTQRAPRPPAAPDASTQRVPNYRIRSNVTPGPPKGSRFNPERTSTWSHLQSKEQPRDRSRQHGGQGRDNASRRPRDRDSQPMSFLNPSGPSGQKSSAHDSQEFSSILARLGSKRSHPKQPTSEAPTGSPKFDTAPIPSGVGNNSLMYFGDYSRRTSNEQPANQSNATQQTESTPKEESSDDLDFTQTAPSPRPNSASQQTPAAPDSNSALEEKTSDSLEDFDFTGTTPAPRSTSPFQRRPDVPVAETKAPETEEYQDPSDEFDFTATAPRPRASQGASASTETPPTTSDQTDAFDFTAPQPTRRPSLATQQESSAAAESTTNSFEDFDFAEPRSSSRPQLTQWSQTNAPFSSNHRFEDDTSTFSEQEPSSNFSISWGGETWAQAAARRAAEEAKPVSTSNQTPWKLPPEEPQRKSRSSRFAQDEEEVDDGRRKRKDKRSFKKSDESFDLEGGIKAEAKAERKARKRQEHEASKGEVDKPTRLYLPEYISVSNFANLLKVRTETLLKKMEEFGYEDVRHDDILNAENAGLIAAEYNFEPIPPLPDDMDLYPTPEPEDRSVLPLRPPVVTIMGHVDHGKTTLLDFLRKSSVAASEFGGITQHIGAFNVPLSSGKTITFLDTPGHAAFLNMRQRGANVTDIVILVVAADDGVKAQTEEAIKHAQSAGVPMIVAINKIDKEGADPQRVKQDLARHDVYVEDFGGDIQAIPVSGKTGQGMQDLEEATSLLSEILDHRADPTGPVEGHIIEASTKERGRVATLLVRRGTLKVGDIIVAGTTFARVRTMRNEAGEEVETVGPGMPAEIDGWRGQPEAGDEFLEAPNEQRANEAIEYRTVTEERVKMAKDMEAIAEARRQEHERREKEAQRQEEIAKATKAGIENPEKHVAEMEKAKESGEEKQERKEVPLVLKADVSGSEEACHDYIMTVGNNEVCPKIARSGVGPVTEFDVEFASAAKGYIVAFNVEIPQHIRRLAGYHGVKLLENNVIYRLVDDIKKVLSERLPPLVTHKVTGELKILQAFEINIGGRRTMRIAGCRVENGMVRRTSKVKVLRGTEVIYQGTLSSLKNVKRDVSEMPKYTECGIGFDGWTDFNEGDAIQCYEEVFQKRYL